MTVETIVSAPLGVAGEYPSHNNKLGLGGVHIFTTIAERDAMWAELKDKDTIALVGVGENKFPSWYKWESGKWHFAGYFGGVVLADVDGALTHVDSTAVFGSDFEIQSAGDAGQGVLIMLSAATKAEIAKQAAPASLPFSKVLPPLQIDKGSLLVNPEAYEQKSKEGYFAYFDMDEIVVGKSVPGGRRDGAVWADKLAWGANNVNMYADRASKAVVLQEADGKDPNVTGGAPILCGLHIGFYGNAPDDGTLECYLYNHDTGSPILDAANQPIGAIHHYSSGQKLNSLTVAQVHMAKGAVKASWRVRHTFTSDPVRMGDWATTGSCMMYQQLGSGQSLSPAINEFQELIGKPLRIMPKYYGSYIAGNAWELGVDVASTVLDANQGMDSVIGLDLENPTKIKAAVDNNLINFKDDSGTPAMFNLAIELSAEDTRNLRGKEVGVHAMVFNRYNAVRLCMFVYTGDMADVPRPVLTGFNNDQYILASGWAKVDDEFLPEHAEGSFHNLGKNFVIPNAAKLVMFGYLPNSEQSPCDISIQPITIEAVSPFTAYDVSISPNADQLMFTDAISEFVTKNKLWKIGASKTTLPFGEVVSKVNNAPVELYVEEDDTNTYNGGLKLTETTEYKIEVWLSIGNYFKSKVTKPTVLAFGVDLPSGDVISGSEQNLTIKEGDFNNHVLNWSFTYDNKLAGTIIKLWGESDGNEVAFLNQGAYNAAGVMITAKVVK